MTAELADWMHAGCLHCGGQLIYNPDTPEHPWQHVSPSTRMEGCRGCPSKINPDNWR